TSPARENPGVRSINPNTVGRELSSRGSDLSNRLATPRKPFPPGQGIFLKKRGRSTGGRRVHGCCSTLGGRWVTCEQEGQNEKGQMNVFTVSALSVISYEYRG